MVKKKYNICMMVNYITHNLDDVFLHSEKYYLHGVMDRTNGPAFITYNKDGSIYSEVWYTKGKRCNKNGPTVIHYSEGKAYSYYW